MLLRNIRYPTAQQNRVWLRRRSKIAPSEIANEMKVSRPYVSQAQRIAKTRIGSLLSHAASIAGIHLEHISASHGIAIGHCPALESTVYVTYSPKIGVHAWYNHAGNCSDCSRSDTCERILDSLSKEWGIEVPDDLPPTQKGKQLFDEILEELGWKKQE